MIYRKDLTSIEIAFIRGGSTNYVPSNQLETSSSSINDQEEEYLEHNESPQLSSRSSLDNNAELNGYLNEMPHSSIDTAMNRTSPRTQFIHNGHPHNGAVMPSYHPVNSYPHHASGYQHPYAASNGYPPPPRQGFNPTISSTPNGLPNGQPLPVSYEQMNGQ